MFGSEGWNFDSSFARADSKLNRLFIRCSWISCAATAPARMSGVDWSPLLPLLLLCSPAKVREAESFPGQKCRTQVFCPDFPEFLLLLPLLPSRCLSPAVNKRWRSTRRSSRSIPSTSTTSWGSPGTRSSPPSSSATRRSSRTPSTTETVRLVCPPAPPRRGRTSASWFPCCPSSCGRAHV